MYIYVLYSYERSSNVSVINKWLINNLTPPVGD